MGTSMKALLTLKTTLPIHPSFDKLVEYSTNVSGILPGLSRAALLQVIITLGVFAASSWEEKTKQKPN